MLADYLIGCIALDAFGAGIPRQTTPLVSSVKIAQSRTPSMRRMTSWALCSNGLLDIGAGLSCGGSRFFLLN
jgi:hypothetical protein